jgi:aldehyde dehydrogenase (NAD+)
MWSGTMAAHELCFYIGGEWVEPATTARLDVIDPSTEEPFSEIGLGTATDVDRAVASARAAFPAYAVTSVAERIALLQRIIAIYERRSDELAACVSREMGAPITLARKAQAPLGSRHLRKCVEVLETFRFDEPREAFSILHEPIGVCGLVTPWNWPLNQIVSKVAPALAAGCTIVLKPSEIAPLNAILLAEILDEAAVPRGVFNLVNGTGPVAGMALASHPDVDLISFTGSTRAGVAVAKAAADNVKRVTQELGGKSANILLPDADFETAVTKGMLACCVNTGQSCNAPTRMLVPEEKLDECCGIAAAAAESVTIGRPDDPATTMGPLASKAQLEKVEALVRSGIDEGASLLCGGLGRPVRFERGYFVRPTVFARMRRDMRIAREEIFGPVLSIITYRSEAEAVQVANDTPYGLAAYVQGEDRERVQRVARQMRAGNVYLNYPGWDVGIPFGGYKQSGNGREYAEFGLREFLEIKAIVG